MENKTSLATIMDIENPLDVFNKNSAEAILSAIEAEVRGEVYDVSTAKGRKEIASIAYKVSQSKTALDKLGKDLVSNWKAQSKAVDAERKLIRDRLDALRDEVRLPLTKWEKDEEDRKEAERIAKEIEEAHSIALIENDLFDREQEIKRKEEIARIAEEKRIAEETAARLEKEKQEREAEIAKRAAEQARIEAEKAAALEKAESARIAAEALAAEERAKREAEQARIAAAQAAKDAEERHKREIQRQAEELLRKQAEAEQARIDQENLKRQEDERRAANTRHRGAINRKILESMIRAGCEESAAKQIIKLAANGNIPNLIIKY